MAELLLRHRGEYISGEEMARHLGVSRAAVWKAVKQLESEGMCIQAATNRGYALSDAADILSPACISGYLRHPEVFAIQVEKTLDSTNRLARDLAQRGGREGTVVVAGEQTAGRGRLGRSFFSPGGTGVYFSLILRPSPETEASLLTTAAAVAVAQAAEELAKRPAEIKWVNDIYMDGKKICGILTEGTYSIEEGRMESAVLGIGVNVSPPAEGFPEELRKKAGTILEKPGNNARSRLIARILEIFWEYYENLDAGPLLFRIPPPLPASGKARGDTGKRTAGTGGGFGYRPGLFPDPAKEKRRNRAPAGRRGGDLLWKKIGRKSGSLSYAPFLPP